MSRKKIKGICNEDFLFVLAVLLVYTLVVVYCFPVALLKMDTVVQVSIIVFAASLYTASVLNSLYHELVLDRDKKE